MPSWHLHSPFHVLTRKRKTRKRACHAGACSRSTAQHARDARLTLALVHLRDDLRVAVAAPHAQRVLHAVPHNNHVVNYLHPRAGRQAGCRTHAHAAVRGCKSHCGHWHELSSCQLQAPAAARIRKKPAGRQACAAWPPQSHGARMNACAASPHAAHGHAWTHVHTRSFPSATILLIVQTPRPSCQSSML